MTPQRKTQLEALINELDIDAGSLYPENGVLVISGEKWDSTRPHIGGRGFQNGLTMWYESEAIIIEGQIKQES